VALTDHLGSGRIITRWPRGRTPHPARYLRDDAVDVGGGVRVPGPQLGPDAVRCNREQLQEHVRRDFATRADALG
jgi:hypothetical protein